MHLVFFTVFVLKFKTSFTAALMASSGICYASINN